MKRPPAVTASIVVIIILTIFCLVFLLMVSANDDGAREHALAPFAALAQASPFFALIIAGIVDIVFLLLRKKWVYYLNIVILFLTVGLLGAMILYTLLGVMPLLAQIRLGLAVVYAIPAGLLIWLCVELLRREDNLKYLAGNRNQGTG